MSNLFNIRQAERNLAELLTASDGEVTDPVKRLEAYLSTVDVPNAIEGLLSVATEHRSRAEQLKAQAKKWLDEAKAEEAKADRLVASVERYMTDSEIDSLTAGVYKLKFKAMPPKVEVADNLDFFNNVPYQFTRIRPPEFNKVDFLKAWKSDPSISIDGVTVITGRVSLTGHTIKSKE